VRINRSTPSILIKNIALKKTEVHPQYGLGNGLRHDIALVQLKEEVEYGKPAKLYMGEEMIVQGADVRSVEINGISLFELPLLAERKDYLRMLIFKSKHLEIVHPEDSEILPMVVSIFGNSPQILELVGILLDQGANINVQNSEGGTAVILAGWETNNLDLVALLVEHGADVNIPNVNGDTPLIDAADKGKNDILEYLLINGADVDVKNNEGLSALDMAREAKNSGAIDMLMSKSKGTK